MLSRNVRLLVAALAVAAALAGAWLARVSVSVGLYGTFERASTLKPPVNAENEIVRPLGSVATRESIGEGLIGASVLAFVLLAASAARATSNVRTSAGLLALGALVLGALAPGSKLPGVLAVPEMSSQGLDEVVKLDPDFVNAFVVESRRHEWAATLNAQFPDDAQQGADALARSVAARLAREGKTKVRIYFDRRCQDVEVHDAFVGAVKSVTGIDPNEGVLPTPEDYPAQRKLHHAERLRPFQEGAYASTAARLAAALALALAVWWADARGPRAKAAGVLTAGCLVLALAQLLSMPLVLYLGLLSEKSAPTIHQMFQATTPHVALLFVSAAGLAGGAVVVAVGVFLAPDASPDLAPARPRLRSGAPVPGPASVPIPATPVPSPREAGGGLGWGAAPVPVPAPAPAPVPVPVPDAAPPPPPPDMPHDASSPGNPSAPIS